jgi:hypothetical protein
VRIPDTNEQGMQADGPEAHSAGVQAPSMRSPSLLSPGVQVSATASYQAGWPVWVWVL